MALSLRLLSSLPFQNIALQQTDRIEQTWKELKIREHKMSSLNFLLPFYVFTQWTNQPTDPIPIENTNSMPFFVHTKNDREKSFPFHIIHFLIHSNKCTHILIQTYTTRPIIIIPSKQSKSSCFWKRPDIFSQFFNYYFPHFTSIP